MPVYSNSFPPYSISPGDLPATLVSAEQLTTNKFSSRVAIQDPPGFPLRPVVVTFTYASAPSSVQYDIYVAMDDSAGVPGNYTKVGSTTNTAGDQVTFDRGAAGANQFKFICVKEVISPGVNATVNIYQ